MMSARAVINLFLSESGKDGDEDLCSLERGKADVGVWDSGLDVRKLAMMGDDDGGAEKGRRRRRRPSLRRFFQFVAIVIAVVLASVSAYVLLAAEHSPLHVGRRQLLTYFRSTLKWYESRLESRPLGTRCVTSVVIYIFADVSAQKLGGEKFSYGRLLRYISFGMFFMAPFLYAWYQFTLAHGPPDTLAGSIEKALFEQFTLEPFCIVAFILWDGILKRKTPGAILRRIRNETPSLWLKNAVWWLPCNFANYYLNSPELRVVFANTCSFFWNVYFSSMVNRIAPKLGKGKATHLEDGLGHRDS